MNRFTKLLGAMAGLALVMSVGVQKAHATQDVLFPYIINTASEESVLTLIHQGIADVYPGTHIQYWTKDVTAASDAACQPSSVFVEFTANDMMTWGVGDKFGPSGPLLGDMQAAPAGVRMAFSNQHGYAIVAAQNAAAAGTGYQLNIDFVNGSVTSTHGITITGGDNALAMAIAVGATDADAVLSAAGVPVAMLPPGTAAAPSGLVTTFNVTPLNNTMFTAPSLGTVQLLQDPFGLSQGVFNRDEIPIDGTVEVNVVCVANLTLADLAPGVVGNVAFASGGGWAYFNVTTATGPVGALTYAAIVQQVDSDATGAAKTTTDTSPSASKINEMVL